MKLWIASKREDLPGDNDPWRVPWDTTQSVVVRAETETEARSLANSAAGDETRERIDAWTNPQYSTCTEITMVGPPEVICVNYCAG